MRWCARIIFLHVVLLASLAPAQTSQPAGQYDAQAIRTVRNPATTSTNSANGFDWQRLLLALGIVIGLILVLKYIVGKMYPGVGATSAAKAVRVVARSAIAPKQQVMLLQVGRRLIVVGDSAGQLSTLAEIKDSDEVASLLGQLESEPELPARRGFASLFGKAREEFETPSEPAMDAGAGAQSENSVEIDQAQTEISGLIDRMRALTRVVRRD